MAEKEYIERGALIEKLSRMIDYCEKDPKVNGLTALFQVADAVMDCTAADVVEVVRCKDCRFYGNEEYHVFGGECEWFDALVDRNNFCSYGERKERT